VVGAAKVGRDKGLKIKEEGIFLRLFNKSFEINS
jgi:hypothetical protein